MKEKTKNIRVAIVADWLTSAGGAEKVVGAMAEIWPGADIFTSVSNPEKFAWLKGRKLVNSWLNKLPWKNKHQLYSIFRPLAFSSFDFSDYDLVISSASAESKTIITKPETLHICYCHTPIRYFWSDYHEYLRERMEFGWLNPMVRMVMPILVNKLRQEDRLAAERVDYFVANSSYVADRIRKYYRRDPIKVIYPPVDLPEIQDNEVKDGGYFLFIGRLVPYKKADLVVEAFIASGRQLKVIGPGPQKKKLDKMVKGHDNIELLGGVSDEIKHQVLAGCRALVFPSLEDAGIVPLEAMIYGKPVIAYGVGGARETVVENTTGLFFSEQTADSLNRSMDEFENREFDSAKIKGHVKKFSKERFKKEISELVERLTNC